MRTYHDYARDTHFGSRALMGEIIFPAQPTQLLDLSREGPLSTALRCGGGYSTSRRCSLLLGSLLPLPKYASHQASEAHTLGSFMGRAGFLVCLCPSRARMPLPIAGTHRNSAKATEASRYEWSCTRIITIVTDSVLEHCARGAGHGDLPRQRPRPRQWKSPRQSPILLILTVPHDPPIPKGHRTPESTMPVYVLHPPITSGSRHWTRREEHSSHPA